MQAMAEGQAEVQTVQAEEHEQPGPYPIEKLQVRSVQKKWCAVRAVLTGARRTLCVPRRSSVWLHQTLKS